MWLLLGSRLVNRHACTHARMHSLASAFSVFQPRILTGSWGALGWAACPTLVGVCGVGDSVKFSTGKTKWERKYRTLHHCARGNTSDPYISTSTCVLKARVRVYAGLETPPSSCPPPPYLEQSHAQGTCDCILGKCPPHPPPPPAFSLVVQGRGRGVFTLNNKVFAWKWQRHGICRILRRTLSHCHCFAW